MSKQFSLPKTCFILHKMKIGQKIDIRSFLRSSDTLDLFYAFNLIMLYLQSKLEVFDANVLNRD